MDIVNASENTSYRFPSPWLLLVFVFVIGALSLLAIITPGHASDSNPATPTAYAAAASPGEGVDNSRECDAGRGVTTHCVYP